MNVCAIRKTVRKQECAKNYQKLLYLCVFLIENVLCALELPT